MRLDLNGWDYCTAFGSESVQCSLCHYNLISNFKLQIYWYIYSISGEWREREREWEWFKWIDKFLESFIALLLFIRVQDKKDHWRFICFVSRFNFVRCAIKINIELILRIFNWLSYIVYTFVYFNDSKSDSKIGRHIPEANSNSPIITITNLFIISFIIIWRNVFVSKVPCNFVWNHDHQY